MNLIEKLEVVIEETGDKYAKNVCKLALESIELSIGDTADKDKEIQSLQSQLTEANENLLGCREKLSAEMHENVRLSAEVEELKGDIEKLSKLLQESGDEVLKIATDRLAYGIENETLKEQLRWREYPAEKPEKTGRYLVQFPTGNSTVCTWSEDSKGIKKGWLCYGSEIVAWLPIPAQTKKEGE